MAEKAAFQNPYPLGVSFKNGIARISYAAASKDSPCGIVWYDKRTGRQLKKETFSREERVGRIYCREKKWEDMPKPEEVSYLFWEDGSLVPDRYAKGFVPQPAFGRERSGKDLKAVLLTERYDWQGDVAPEIPMQEAIGYCIHVRGFTKHISSKVEHPGTFAGVTEKIPYLKEIGVTTLELQPAYEFIEKKRPEKSQTQVHAPVFEEKKPVLNYWGYEEGYYYVPKAAYSYSEDSAWEFRNMVRQLHISGIEVIMQFYFPVEIPRTEIQEILRYWKLFYHVDGFRLLGVGIPAAAFSEDALLCDSKIWYEAFEEEKNIGENLSYYKSDYLYTMRRFLKGDDGMLEGALYQMRYLPVKAGRVHYLTNYDGFTLMDMVSDEEKHNEINGENNRDGNDYNCSWNCGEEGATRREKIKKLRIRQIKNAICLLLLSHSTPLIFMGDEFGNSQKGNNNPYCQDNLITWLDWNELEKQKEIMEFWKQMVKLRGEYKALHPGKAFKLMDTLACGYPDLSYHGETAWHLPMQQNSRYAGLLFCEKYAEQQEAEERFLYVGINMHWEKHSLALPRLPKESRWKILLSTGGQAEDGKETLEDFCKVEPRSITLCISEKEEGTGGRRNKISQSGIS